ncbi:helix-turn-helix domain-containing protein [uncultured Winogradskyella sp.]|uniref:helix-turn-helix domain-containing protein n=1 Tax=uncultured Winogradskyella sp. TaxID=395353 RepID=UPI00260DFBD3|nr:helix-turn-helix domain-containing protein [uncultured Winogradskyella sp.]|tara:strand:+ start:96 stop:2534 length:2439 start_codon:yes stop_codon:yes gene_type:complete
MVVNKEIDLAWKFVTKTNRNIFLTGKAGTGKTTFLHKLKLQSNKRMVIVAPTGVAAINAKGVTIHSFFQMPFGPILPNESLTNSAGFNRKFSKTKINIIKSLDLLVIDEISMVRADLLDGIDKTLRRYKNRDKIFGGVQLLMIGDLQQLSPVVKDNEWRLLQPFYKNAYFFSSISYQSCYPISIELKHIYRQDNPVFIDILNEIRNNRLSEKLAKELNRRFIPNFEPNKDDGYISLTTHNNKARQNNLLELRKLKGREQTYKAKIEGNFPENSYPNKEELVLKVGAQVMFIKNDSSPDKRYYNGKIGKVILLEKDEVVVHCPDDDFNINAKLETWENIKYNVDSDTKAISEDKIGSYSQIPLRLAWSITIHKSQGLTFEKAIIDAQGAFAHGQTYVALSRCKSLEGLVLKSKIESNQIISDQNVITFNENAEENQPDEQVLLQSERDYQLMLISEIFDFYKFLYPINRMLDIFYKNRGSIEGIIEEPLNTIKTGIANLLKVSNGFKLQLDTLLEPKAIPESHPLLQERFNKALSYFDEKTNSIIKDSFKKLTFTTDNKAVDKDLVTQLDMLEELFDTKISFFNGLKDGFNTDKFLSLRAKSVFLGKEKPKKIRKMIIDGTTNVELFELLRELRNQIANREDLVHFQVFTQKSLYAMCETLPTSKEELKKIHGMGKTRVEKYGTEILKVIISYCDENDIETSSKNITLDLPKPKRKTGETKLESLKLYKDGKSIDEIAVLRDLNENTIFGHLASFISSGEIKITELIDEAKYNELKQIIPSKTFENLSDLKHLLDDKYSYGELRLVVNELSNN